MRDDGLPEGRHPPGMTPTRSVDRDRLSALMADESRRFAEEHPRSADLHRPRPRVTPRGRSHALDGEVGRPVPALRRVRFGRVLPMRRRSRLRRLLPRRHGGDGRPRACPDDRGGRAPDAPRDHPHAPDRGRGLGRRGADDDGSGCRPGSSRCPPRTRTASRSAWLATSPAVPRSSSTTTATTGRSTRRSRSSARTGRSCRCTVRSGPRWTSHGPRAWSSSTTSPDSRPPSPIATWRPCSSSQPSRTSGSCCPNRATSTRCARSPAGPARS